MSDDTPRMTREDAVQYARKWQEEMRAVSSADSSSLDTQAAINETRRAIRCLDVLIGEPEVPNV